MAHETDALGTLCQLTTHAGLQPNAAEMFNNIVLRWGLITCCMLGCWLDATRGWGLGDATCGIQQSQPATTIVPSNPPSSCPLPLCSLCSTMSAAFAAFNFSPAALPLPQLELVARILANLFRWVVLTPQSGTLP